MNFHKKHYNSSKAGDLESTQILSKKRECQALSLGTAALLNKKGKIINLNHCVSADGI